jgi:hypothetical protein
VMGFASCDAIDWRQTGPGSSSSRSGALCVLVLHSTQYVGAVTPLGAGRDSVSQGARWCDRLSACPSGNAQLSHLGWASLAGRHRGCGCFMPQYVTG